MTSLGGERGKLQKQQTTDSDQLSDEYSDSDFHFDATYKFEFVNHVTAINILFFNIWGKIALAVPW